MCWTGYLANKKIAASDIRCKKIIAVTGDGKFRAWFKRNHEYALDVPYHATMTPKSHLTSWESLSEKVEINEGLHCYDGSVKITKVPEELPYLVIQKLKGCFNRDFYHAHHIDEFHEIDVTPVIVEVVIPKGTVFYENEFGEIVTEAFTLTKVIEPDNIRKL